MPGCAAVRLWPCCAGNSSLSLLCLPVSAAAVGARVCCPTRLLCAATLAVSLLLCLYVPDSAAVPVLRLAACRVCCQTRLLRAATLAASLLP
jgi:hypothetical protein